jgi:NitT/TauT family transport system ATP-binding protein
MADVLSSAVQDRKASDKAPDVHISIRNVEKVYRSQRGSVVALENVSLDVATGEFVSILGPSGCGKSTLLKCIAGLEPLSGGEIFVSKKRIVEPPKDLGVVFQRDILFDWRTALDNVLVTVEFLGLKRRDYEARAGSLLATYGLAGYENRYPWELSGGQRQRVAICRAMVHDPQFLLMDEPFGALDALTRDELNLELQNRWFADRKTIIFITHGIAEAVFLSDRVIVMGRNPGRIIADVKIDLPRPRAVALRDTAAFTAYTGRLRAIMDDANAGITHTEVLS